MCIVTTSVCNLFCKISRLVLLYALSWRIVNLGLFGVTAPTEDGARRLLSIHAGTRGSTVVVTTVTSTIVAVTMMVVVAETSTVAVTTVAGEEVTTGSIVTPPVIETTAVIEGESMVARLLTDRVSI